MDAFHLHISYSVWTFPHCRRKVLLYLVFGLGLYRYLLHFWFTDIISFPSVSTIKYLLNHKSKIYISYTYSIYLFFSPTDYDQVLRHFILFNLPRGALIPFWLAISMPFVSPFFFYYVAFKNRYLNHFCINQGSATACLVFFFLYGPSHYQQLLLSIVAFPFWYC